MDAGSKTWILMKKLCENLYSIIAIKLIQTSVFVDHMFQILKFPLGYEHFLIPGFTLLRGIFLECIRCVSGEISLDRKSLSKFCLMEGRV